jgi:predicted metal-binding protein
LLNRFAWAIVFKIDVPTAILLSSDRREIFCLLHEIAAGVETVAVEKGGLKAMAFAGGSCKRLFCNDHQACRVIAGSEQGCRYPDSARPSMSGFGVNVAELMKTAGWRMTIAKESEPSEGDSTAPVCGLILINRSESELPAV